MLTDPHNTRRDGETTYESWGSLGERAIAIEVQEAANQETMKADLRFQAWMRKNDGHSAN